MVVDVIWYRTDDNCLKIKLLMFSYLIFLKAWHKQMLCFFGQSILRFSYSSIKIHPVYFKPYKQAEILIFNCHGSAKVKAINRWFMHRFSRLLLYFVQVLKLVKCCKNKSGNIFLSWFFLLFFPTGRYLYKEKRLSTEALFTEFYGRCISRCI